MHSFDEQKSAKYIFAVKAIKQLCANLPSVIIIAILAALALSPLAVEKEVCLAYLMASAVCVVPLVYLKC